MFSRMLQAIYFTTMLLRFLFGIELHLKEVKESIAFWSNSNVFEGLLPIREINQVIFPLVPHHRPNCQFRHVIGPKNSPHFTRANATVFFFALGHKGVDGHSFGTTKNHNVFLINVPHFFPSTPVPDLLKSNIEFIRFGFAVLDGWCKLGCDTVFFFTVCHNLRCVVVTIILQEGNQQP